MRILMLNHNLVGRGSYLRCWHLARQLVRRGHEVEIVTASDCRSMRWTRREEEGIQILIPPRLGRPGRHDGGYAPVDIFCRIPTALKRWDVIHAFEHRPNVSTPALLSRLRKTPLVSDWSDWWTRGGITTPRRRFGIVDRWEGVFLEEGTKRFSDRVTVVSAALYQRARMIGIPENRIDWIPSGCDVERIHPRDKAECRRLLGLPENSPVVCFVGFAFWDFGFLLLAFREVLGEFPSARLLVVGEDKDGQIENLAAEMLGPSAGQVVFAGRFNPADLEIPLGASDVQLLPLEKNLANQARWPIKFGDYLASGRPLVVSDVGDVPGYILEDRAGKVTGPSAQDFAEGIRELLRDPQSSRESGANARHLAETTLSWEVQGAAMEQAYLRCISPNR